MRLKLLCAVLLSAFITTTAHADRIGVLIREADLNPDGYAYQLQVDNGTLTIADGVATIDLSGAAGGQAVTLDLADDASDESVDLGEIATSGDTNSIFTEPSADKLLIDVSQNWPTADTANAGDSATAFFSAGTIEAARLPTVSGSGAGIVPTTSGVSDGWVLTVQGDESVAWEAVAGTGDVTSVGDCTDGACLDGSSDGGTYIRIYDGDSHYGAFDVPDISANVTYTFPAASATLMPDTGSANIVTVGTIATGTWQGDAIGTTYAGTDLDHSNLAATITFADGDLVDLSGITQTGSADEGLALPTWADVTPTTDKPFIAWDAAAGSLKVYDGGWVAIDPTGAPTTAKYIVQQADATLSNEQALGALASGILYSTTTTGVVSIATEAQMETTLGIAFGTAKTATSGYVLVGDGTDFEAVAMSGDVTIASGGATTIGANTVALTTDTTGNYVATIADAGNSNITVTNGTAEGGAVTLDVVDVTCTDCLNATEIEDIYALNTTDTITGNYAFGDADSDTLTLRSYIMGGNSRAVWIDDDGTVAPTYATASNELYVEGDVEVDGTVYATSFESTGVSGDSYIELMNNTSYAPTSGYLVYFEAGTLKSYNGVSESQLIAAADSPTWTGQHSFSTAGASITLPTTDADAAGEISWDDTGDYLLIHVGATNIQKLDFSSENGNNGYVLKTDGSGTWTVQADATGGTPTFDSVGDPVAAVTLEMGTTTETVLFDFVSAFTTGGQFQVRQATGNPTGGTLMTVTGNDDNITLLRVSDTSATNGWKIQEVSANNYELGNLGSGTLNLGAANDLLIGGAQIDFDDMAGTAAIATTNTVKGRLSWGSNITGNITLGDTTNEVHSVMYQVTAACTVTLASASSVGYGSMVTLYVRDASETVIVEIDASDKINLHGTPLDAGDTIDSPGNAGDFITLVATTDADGSGTDGWITLGYGEAVWTDGGAT